MKRDKAIEAMDLLSSQGYYVQIHAVPTPIQHVRIERGVDGENKVTSDPSYMVTINSLSFDTIDLRHLCDQAEDLGLIASTSKMDNLGTIVFSEPDLTPAPLRSQRQHPRQTDAAATVPEAPTSRRLRS